MTTLEIKRENGKILSFIRNKMLVETPEERVRQEFVMLLVNKFGYPLEVMAEEYSPDYPGRGVRGTRADIVIWKSIDEKVNNRDAFIVVECKAETVKIRLEDFYQGTEYASKLRPHFLVLHNSKETNYYAIVPDKMPNTEDGYIQITTIPNYSDINNPKTIESIKNQTKVFTREGFTSTLRKCHNIIRNNDKLSPEAAFDEISKILFMKIKEERKARGTKVFTQEQFLLDDAKYEKDFRPLLKKAGTDMSYLNWMFEQTKEEFKDDQLFDNNESIKIRQNSFEQKHFFFIS